MTGCSLRWLIDMILKSYIHRKNSNSVVLEVIDLA